MKKGEKKDYKDTNMECGLKIELEDDGIAVGVFGKGGKEKLFAEFFSDGIIETLEKIMDGMEMPDGLKAKLFGRWIKQIGKRLEGLEFDNLDD